MNIDEIGQPEPRMDTSIVMRQAQVFVPAYITIFAEYFQTSTLQDETRHDTEIPRELAGDVRNLLDDQPSQLTSRCRTKVYKLGPSSSTL